MRADMIRAGASNLLMAATDPFQIGLWMVIQRTCAGAVCASADIFKQEIPAEFLKGE